jgi:hypothetical protein
LLLADAPVAALREHANLRNEAQPFQQTGFISASYDRTEIS